MYTPDHKGHVWDSNFDCIRCGHVIDQHTHRQVRPWIVRCPECRARYRIGLLVLDVLPGLSASEPVCEYRASRTRKPVT